MAKKTPVSTATGKRTRRGKPVNAHAAAMPEALLDFMMEGWKPQSSTLPRPLPAASDHARRRESLGRLFPGEALVIPTGHEQVRANDTNFRFRPGSDFFYLTGNLDPDCVLVMVPEKTGHRSILFVEPNPGRSDATFFTDRNKGELWVGPRLGVEESQARFGVDEARGLPDLPAFLRTLKGGGVRMLRGLSPQLDRLLPERRVEDVALAAALSELRLIKDRREITELTAAVRATAKGFEDVIRALPHAPSERHVEGTFALRARVEGNDVGYGIIAAAGANACVLHWTRNDGPLKPDELLLLDAGVEGHSLYTADITRTVPIGGRFSPEQREIYTLVLEAQRAAIAAVKPGNDFMEPNRRAMEVLARGLERLGILEDAETALQDSQQLYRRYSLHNVSHMLGLDVHDCAKARQETYRYGKLQPGMVLTVEPGLYFQKDDLTVPRRYRGIGVRIEDDLLVTARGHRNLSGFIPTEPDEIEAWMARLWSEKTPGTSGGKPSARRGEARSGR